MTKILTKEDVLENIDFYVNEILNNKIFIYPTDTIYGIGNRADIDQNILKIKEIKKRDKKTFLVIAPSINWMKENIDLEDIDINNLIQKFKTQHSFIFKLKNKDIISPKLIGENNTIGVRYPNHWFTKLIEKANIPFITTSVNLSGKDPIKKLENDNINNLDENIKNSVDYVIIDDESVLGKASTIIDLTNDKEKILR